MAKIDLNVFQFDYDLTLAILLMHPDGTVYHRYGARDETGAMSWMGMDSLVPLLEATRQDHRAYSADPVPIARKVPRLVTEMPPLKRRMEVQKIDCVHCHTVHDTMYQWAVEQADWRPYDGWIYPPPAQVGLALDARDQALIKTVAADTPAAVAGLAAGDRLQRFGEQSIVRTISDVQWALHVADGGATTLPVTYLRDGEQRKTVLELGAKWKRGTPEDYAWRPFKWNLSPAPGFGGPELSDSDKQDLGIAVDRFAFRVNYIVGWGEKAHRAVNVRAAGIRVGDVVTSFAGKSDFTSCNHFHSWVRLTRVAGERVEVEIVRRGVTRVVTLEVPR